MIKPANKVFIFMWNPEPNAFCGFYWFVKFDFSVFMPNFQKSNQPNSDFKSFPSWGSFCRAGSKPPGHRGGSSDHDGTHDQPDPRRERGGHRARCKLERGRPQGAGDDGVKPLVTLENVCNIFQGRELCCWRHPNFVSCHLCDLGIVFSSPKERLSAPIMLLII